MATQQTSNQPLVSIYWDYQNVNLNEQNLSLLQNFARVKGNLISTKLYYNSLTYRKCLQFTDVTCVDVPCLLKNSSDNQIKSDLIDDISQQQPPDIVILVSGDGDFANCIKLLKNIGKRIIVFARVGNVKLKLKELSHEFYDVNNLQQLMMQVTESLVNFKDLVTTKSTVVLNYQEATQYLIEAIQMASSQNISPGFSNIDKLMRKHFPSYQGARSIYNDNGKKFSSFSKFIVAVVSDGKIAVNDGKVIIV